MKDKKIIGLMIVSLVFVFIFMNLNFVKADGTSLCSPTITLVSQDPVKAIPDSYVKVVFELTGLTYCNGFSVKLEPTYPFSLDPGTDPVQTIAKGPYITDYTDSWIVPYKIRVASDALEGDYNLRLRYNQGSNADFSSVSFKKDFNISVTDVQTNFDAVLQEVSGTQVSIGIVNTGKNTANSLVVKIPSQDSFRVTGTSDQIVGNLASGDYSLVTFNIASSGFSRNSTRTSSGQQSGFNANMTSPQDRVLKVQIDYTDGIGERRTVITNISASSLIFQQTNQTTRTNGARTGSANTSSSNKYAIYILIIAGLIIAFMVYRKYNDPMRKDSHRNNRANSKEAPEWVLAERKHRKK